MKTVAIPIETKAREFHGKLWLASKLVEYNCQVVLGPSDQIQNTLDLSRPDVYITKDPGDNNIRFFEILSESGCKVCGLDPEGAIFSTLENYSDKKNRVFDYLDLYFVWGDAQAEVLKEKSDFPERIVTTGNPRFDLLNPSLRFFYQRNVAELRSEYGVYVLFNMNFPWANHYNLQKHMNNHKRIYGEYDINKHTFISSVFHSFISSLFQLLSENPQYNIVIRPHPSEDHTTYEELFSMYQNLYVEYEGDVRDWIAGSEVVVHNSCTTGIESAMMQQPVIAYQPIKHQKYDKYLPNIVSNQTFNYSGLSKRISYWVDNDEPYEMTDDQHRELKPYFHNVDTVAAESIAEHIDILEIPAEQSYSHLKPELIERIKWRAKASSFSDVATSAYDSINTAFGNADPAERREYRRQKFPGLTKKEIRTTLQRFETDIETESIEITSVSRVTDTFVIEPK